MNTKDIIIYGAGKTWAAHDLKKMRDFGFNINSRWIDLDQVLANPQDRFTKEQLADSKLTANLWDSSCKLDSCGADMMVLVAQEQDGNLHSGSLVELGHITACWYYTGIRKPVYILGDCESMRPIGASDRAWKFQSDVYHWPEEKNVLKGFHRATEHYRNNYRNDWLKSRHALDMIAANLRAHDPY